MRSENWARYRIGSSEPVSEYLMRIRAEVATLENASRVQWTGRRTWGTHLYPGGCWICDGFGVIHGLLALLEEAHPDEVDSGESMGLGKDGGGAVKYGRVGSHEQESIG